MDNEQPTPCIQLGAFSLNTQSFSFFINQKEVSITPIEYEMMLLLMLHPGRVYSREEFIQNCWPADTWVSERTVDVNIGRLRKKMGPYSHHLKAKVGFGYMLSV